MKKIKVLIVDDSALIREMFQEALASDPDIIVIGTANDPYDAREKIKALNPDVITLDIEMPKMDGITFLKKIMSLRPTPVVMVSSLTQRGAQATIECLEIGAVDYVPKSGSESFNMDDLQEVLIRKVKNAAYANVKVYTEKNIPIKPSAPSTGYQKNILIAIGASTGGVEALRDVIGVMPPNSPPIVIVQHMPTAFTGTFAKRLHNNSNINVYEAKDGMKIEAGSAYLAPGSHHLTIAKGPMGLVCRLKDGELVSGHKPSVDVLFSSVAKVMRGNAVGVILTGMGKDGAKSMVELKQSGAFNIGQDEVTSVVYGMPKAAYLAGAVDKQVPLNKVTVEILNKCK